MIRKIFPSAIGSSARFQCASKMSTDLAAMRCHATVKRAGRRRFLLPLADLRQCEMLPCASRRVLSRALRKPRARQVLPRGRQNRPTKYLKNNEKSSPGFVLRVVQGIESRSAGGYGNGVGEWG
jgi:hypothetical protein